MLLFTVRNRDLFQFAGPKFIVACVPDYSVSANTSNALINQQVWQLCLT